MTERMTLIGSMSKPRDSGFRHFVEELQRCKLATETGEPVTFEIKGNLLNVWVEKRPPAEQMAELRELRAGIDRDRAELDAAAKRMQADAEELVAGIKREHEQVEAVKLEVEAVVKKIRADAEAFAAQVWPVPPSKLN